MHYLGLDLSLRATGVSILRDDVILSSCTLKTKSSGAERINSIKSRILTLIGEHIIGEFICALEGYAFVKNVRGQYSKAELHGVIVDTLFENHIEPIIVPPTTLKKFAVGSGKASKQDMINWAKGKYIVDKIDDNQADSIALAYYAKQIHSETK